MKGVRVLLMSLLILGCGEDKLDKIQSIKQHQDSSQDDGLIVGDIRISPSTVDFGAVTPGSSDAVEVVLTNLGDNITLLTDAFIDGDAAFGMTASTPVDLVPGADVVLTVTFSPTAEQDYTGSLNLLLGGQTDFTILPITGTGGEEVTGGDDTDTTGGGDGDKLSLDVTTISFGRVGIGSIQYELITITNISNDDVLIGTVETTAPGIFEGDIGAPTILSPGESDDLLVRFSPKTESTVSATLTLVNDSGINPTITVTGEGFEDCSICSPILTVLTGGSTVTTMDQFKATPTNNPDTQSLVLTNTGDVDLTISGITIKNDSDAPSKITCGRDGNYALTGASFPIVIGPYGSESVSVNFTYSGTALFCGEATLDPSDNKLTITSDSSTGSTYTVSLGGAFTLY